MLCLENAQKNSGILSTSPQNELWPHLILFEIHFQSSRLFKIAVNLSVSANIPPVTHCVVASDECLCLIVVVFLWRRLKWCSCSFAATCYTSGSYFYTPQSRSQLGWWKTAYPLLINTSKSDLDQPSSSCTSKELLSNLFLFVASRVPSLMSHVTDWTAVEAAGASQRKAAGWVFCSSFQTAQNVNRSQHFFPLSCPSPFEKPVQVQGKRDVCQKELVIDWSPQNFKWSGVIIISRFHVVIWQHCRRAHECLIFG